MDLNKLESKPSISPPLIALYGAPGIGKTAFALGTNASTGYKNGRDSHLHINIDFRGSDRLSCKRVTDVLGHPIETIQDIKDIFKALAENDHNFSWIVFDDLTTIEEIFVKEICKQYNVDELKKIEYGNGYRLARVKWYEFFSMIEELQKLKQIGVILIGHTKVENKKDPMSESYSRHDLQLNDKSREIVKNAVELIGFAHRKTLTKQIDAGFGKKENVPVGEAERIISFLPDQEGFESKDRFGLPKEIKLDWEIFEQELIKTIKKDNKKEKK